MHRVCASETSRALGADSTGLLSTRGLRPGEVEPDGTTGCRQDESCQKSLRLSVRDCDLGLWHDTEPGLRHPPVLRANSAALELRWRPQC